jgi:hypothetical protein
VEGAECKHAEEHELQGDGMQLGAGVSCASPSHQCQDVPSTELVQERYALAATATPPPPTRESPQ